jgi:immune inhibitor A
VRKLPLGKLLLRKPSSRNLLIGAAAVTLAAGSAAFIPSALAQSTPQAPAVSEPQFVGSDDLPNPVSDKARAMHEEAVSGVVIGKYSVQTINGSKVVKVNNKD